MLRSMAERGLGELVARWGGVEALDHLDIEPLPDEPFDWTAVPPEHRGRVEQILAMVDDTCDTWFDREHRTACRRLLARVAAEPWVIARRGKAETIAGAIVWTIASFNGTVGRRRRGVRPATWIAGHLGLASPSAFPTRSIDIRVAAGIHLHRDGPEPVGEPGSSCPGDAATPPPSRPPPDRPRLIPGCSGPACPRAWIGSRCPHGTLGSGPGSESEAAIDRAFAEGFACIPDTDEELTLAASLACRSIDEEPWQPWW
jgi:hypothetical protein